MIDDRGGVQVTRANLEEYRLHLGDGRWERLTDRGGWRQFEIRRVAYGLLLDLPDPSNLKCGDLAPSYGFDEEVFRPRSIPNEPLPTEDIGHHGFVVDDITIRATVDAFLVRLIVEGTLPKGLVDRVIAEILENIEAAIRAPCVITGL